MGVHSLLSTFSVLSLCTTFLVVLMTEPYKSFGFISGLALESPPDGICATSITIHGYECQEYEVTTDDGYILSVQRIPQGRVGGGTNKKLPVILQHGLFLDGRTWVLNSPDQNLGFILADRSFDVWIANTRGTHFSRRHVSRNPTSLKFWDWSWDDLAAHDLPAVIDLVFNQTGQKVNYVGHSQGTLIALALFSQAKQIDKVNSVALLSPIAYLSFIPEAIIAKGLIAQVPSEIGFGEFDPTVPYVQEFVGTLCAKSGFDCFDVASAFTGINCCLNGSVLDVFLKYELQPTATKNLLHYAQTARDGIFRKYDYGNFIENEFHYGKTTPPVYDLSAIPRNLPLFLSYGGRDLLSDVLDVQTLLKALKLHDPDKLSVQYIKNYAHLDFIFGVNAKDVVFSKVMSFILQHS
ncbi:sterol esterase [Sarracenia purpurea var. burkii]